MSLHIHHDCDMFKTACAGASGSVRRAARRVARCRVRRAARKGTSLLEMIAVVTLLGIVVALVWSRYSGEQIKGVKKSTCEVQQGQIDTQAFLWFRNRGSWPLGDLSDIGGDTRYFQHGLPQCPVDGTAYELDAVTHRVKPHAH